MPEISSASAQELKQVVVKINLSLVSRDEPFPASKSAAVLVGMGQPQREGSVSSFVFQQEFISRDLTRFPESACTSLLSANTGTALSRAKLCTILSTFMQGLDTMQSNTPLRISRGRES